MFHNNDWGMDMMNNNFYGRQNKSEEKESPLDILKRRYANGEISTEEFEERRNKLKSS